MSSKVELWEVSLHLTYKKGRYTDPVNRTGWYPGYACGFSFYFDNLKTAKAFAKKYGVSVHKRRVNTTLEDASKDFDRHIKDWPDLKEEKRHD